VTQADLRVDPPVDWVFARRYRRSGAVKAVQLTEPRRWTTERGDVLSAEAGDWLLSDSSSAWTVAAEVFASTYEQRPDGRWIKVAVVEAVRVDVPTACHTLEGMANARPGDYVLRNPSGEVWPVAAERFERTYAPVEG
jgi:hypothetical protein